MLRYSGLGISKYGQTLKCLACESLRLVIFPGRPANIINTPLSLCRALTRRTWIHRLEFKNSTRI
jgi:hypothetical protein